MKGTQQLNGRTAAGSRRRWAKRLRTGLALLFLTALLTACAPEEGSVTVLRVWGTEEAGRQETAGTEQGLRVGMVTDVGGIEDASFNQSAWEGLRELASATGISIGYTQPSSNDNLSDEFRRMAEDGYNMIWGIGFSCADALLETAVQYPDTTFALVDASYEETPDNVTCVVFRAEDASFLVGYIAGSVTRSGKVGFVGGVVSEAIDLFQYGFQAGVAWADHESGRTTEVEVEYADDFGKPERGQEIARSMFGHGCDIVYHAAGATGIGVIEAATEAGQFAIGVDRDQSYLDPDHVLTSALKRVNVAVMQISRDWLSGREVGGKTFQFGLPEGAVGIPSDHSNYPDAVYNAVLRLSDQLVSGKIVPPGNQEAFDRFLAELTAETESLSG